MSVISFEAKEWGDKTLVSHKGGIINEIQVILPAQKVINIRFREFCRIMENKDCLPTEVLFSRLTNEERIFLITGYLSEF